MTRNGTCESGVIEEFETNGGGEEDVGARGGKGGEKGSINRSTPEPRLLLLPLLLSGDPKSALDD